ncbi:MAG: hypothetical protein ABI769_13615 [Pseudomonadota bacterium]
MNAGFLPRLSIVVLLGFQLAHAGDLPDYIRFAEDGKSVRLETAIRTFTMPSGKKVDLIGVVHIADDAYYQQLNKRFDTYDAVLFELVGNPQRLTLSAPLTDEQKRQQVGDGTLSSIQQAVGQYLNLTFQLGAIDYSKKNMVHADATAEEFEKMQEERGETTMTLFARAMQAQLSGQIDPAAMGELDTFGLIRILMSRDSAAEFKKALAKTFDQMESITAIMEGKDGSAILGGRNAMVVSKIKEVLALKKQRRIAVFYGGAHMPGIESALITDMKAKASGEEWLAAWTMPK